jgi:hypothetical protein
VAVAVAVAAAVAVVVVVAPAAGARGRARLRDEPLLATTTAALAPSATSRTAPSNDTVSRRRRLMD